MGDNNIILFPLLRLPKRAQQNTIQVMDPLESLVFSTVSKTAKALVKSSKLRCRAIMLKFDEIGRIIISFPYPDTSEFVMIQLGFPLENTNFEGDLVQETLVMGQVWARDNFDIRSRTETTCHLKAPNNSIGCWIQHFLSVLNRNFINLTLIQEEIVSVNSIRHIFAQNKTFGLDLDFHLSPDFMVSAVETIALVEQLALNAGTIPHHAFTKINMQNLNQLELSRHHSVTFEDLLMNNSAHFAVGFILEPKLINRFVKCWMKMSNLNLKSIRLSARILTNHEETKKMILVGINGVEQRYEPVKSMVLASRSGYEPIIQELSNGLAIRRQDGTEATIHFEDSRLACRFQMFIWQ